MISALMAISSTAAEAEPIDRGDDRLLSSTIAQAPETSRRPPPVIFVCVGRQRALVGFAVVPFLEVRAGAESSAGPGQDGTSKRRLIVIPAV